MNGSPYDWEQEQASREAEALRDERESQHAPAYEPLNVGEGPDELQVERRWQLRLAVMIGFCLGMLVGAGIVVAFVTAS
jgi:hypothetical protein